MRHVIRAFEFILCLTLATGAGVASGQEPIKIGFISPLSGAIAQAGKDMYSGCEMFWEESGWQIGGRKLEVILEDNEGVPATALTKARKLVESDRVHLLAGVILSNVAYALVPYIEAQGIPTIYPINSADDLTQRKRPKWLTRTGFSAGGNMHPFGEYAAKVLGYKKVVTVGLDYAFGWETVGGFHKSFEDNGGQVIQKIWVPLNVQDYAPYLASIKKDADAVFVVALGRWTLLFARQYAESGLKGRIPLIANGTYGDGYNNVPGNISGLLYGNHSPKQLLAQLIAAGVCIAWNLLVGGAVFWIIGQVLGSNRVPPAVEVAGLDIPEMGAPGYPEFISHIGQESLASSDISAAR